MRAGLIAAGLASFLSVDVFGTVGTSAFPIRLAIDRLSKNSDITPVNDSCLWWGTRWQYGWRGYGWYTCWELPVPAPTVVAPEATPPEVRQQQSCVSERRREAAGKKLARPDC